MSSHSRPAGSPLSWAFPPLIAAFVRHGRAEALLHEAVDAHVRRVADRYPDAYFELGRRTPEACLSLTDLVFCTAAVRVLGRHPFRGRTPFIAFVLDHTPDAEIRGHTFYFRMSITRERLRDQYHYNLRHDFCLRGRERLYRELGPALAAHAVRVPGQPERWTLSSTGLGRVRARDEVVAELLRMPPATALHVQLQTALRLYRAPVTRSELTHALAEAQQIALQISTSPYNDERTSTVTRPRAGWDQLAVREKVREAWAELDALDQGLLMALAGGATTAEILAQDSRLRDKVQLSRAVDRIGSRFVQAIVVKLGGEPTAGTPPRELIEQIAAVLLLVLPELEVRHV